MTNEMRTIETLAQYWSLQGVGPEGGTTLEAVRLFEDSHRVVVPDDFREYLLRLNGVAQFGSGVDPNGFAFWPLRQIRAVAQEEYPPGVQTTGYFVFADYLGLSWAYAIQLRNDEVRGEVIHVGTLEPKVVAKSFDAFVHMYLADATDLYPSASSKG